MNNKLIAIPVFAILVIAFSACAQTKQSTGKKTRTNTAPVLLQATEQTTLPGRPETPPSTDYRFVLVWKSNEAPLSFFWYKENTWQPLGISTIKNYQPLTTNKKGTASKRNYQIAANSPDKINANDTLLLFPNGRGKHPIPEELKPLNEKIIYYKTAAGKWMSLPIKEVTKLPSIVMP